MYHSIQPTSENELTVSVENLEKQLEYLRKKQFTSLHFKDLKSNLPKKSIIITSDDGYTDNKNFLVPILEKYGFKGVIFLPTAMINRDSDKMTFEDLRSINPKIIELGLHSHHHQNFEKMALKEIENDLQRNIKTLENNNINFTKVLAYPYGRFQKNKSFFKLLERLQIEFALRVGNKINYFPPKNKFTLCRIDVKGSDSLQNFKWKLIFGKIKL